jgi:hypothetical protein
MEQEKREYFLRRAAELELAANAASAPAISQEYRELARTFRELAEATAAGPHGTTDKHATPPE